MKGKNPTREQRRVILENGLDSYKWLVQKDTTEILQIVNRETGEGCVIYKR